MHGRAFKSIVDKAEIEQAQGEMAAAEALYDADDLLFDLRGQKEQSQAVMAAGEAPHGDDT